MGVASGVSVVGALSLGAWGLFGCVLVVGCGLIIGAVFAGTKLFRFWGLLLVVVSCCRECGRR